MHAVCGKSIGLRRMFKNVARKVGCKASVQFRRALPYVNAQDVIVAPDCGMKYLPREVAFGKIRAMVEGARIMRAELGGS